MITGQTHKKSIKDRGLSAVLLSSWQVLQTEDHGGVARRHLRSLMSRSGLAKMFQSLKHLKSVSVPIRPFPVKTEVFQFLAINPTIVLVKTVFCLFLFLSFDGRQAAAAITDYSLGKYRQTFIQLIYYFEIFTPVFEF